MNIPMYNIKLINSSPKKSQWVLLGGFDVWCHWKEPISFSIMQKIYHSQMEARLGVMVWKVQDWRLLSFSNNKNLKEAGNRISSFVKSMPFLINYRSSKVTRMSEVAPTDCISGNGCRYSLKAKWLSPAPP